MNPFPSIQHISGVGTPRLVLVLDRPMSRIKASYVSNPGRIECWTKHNLLNGSNARIAGHSGSTPSINADYTITKIDDYTFTIPVNITVAGTLGTVEALTHIYESTGSTSYTTATLVSESGGGNFPLVKSGHRIRSFVTVSGVDKETWAKVISKPATNQLGIDAWTNGKPANGNVFRIDGFIADLPRTQEMTETFDPDVLIHSLFNGDNGSVKKIKMRGWKYTCVLDYSKYTNPDMLYDLRYILAQKATDQLILIPRIDAPQFQYDVYFSAPANLTKYGRSPGYRKTIFSFVNKFNLASWPLIDGYGTNYAGNYGTNF